ncbi:hypothetical protein LTR86_007988 [Recurvomyces mirabilis]|nr:hypothetical protein LTR86_007988 [Recurvomyces mirabilis]
MATRRNGHGLLALPAEVLAEILSFITAPADQVTVCLVCTEAREVMLPILYNTIYLVIDDDSDARQQVAPLLNSSNLSVKHVRHLRLDTTDPSSTTPELMLIMIVNILPRDCLRTLSSNVLFDDEQDQHLLILLGQHQRKLVHLSLSKTCIDAFLGVQAGRIEYLPGFESLETTRYDELIMAEDHPSEVYSVGFEQLRSLRIDLSDEEDAEDTDEVELTRSTSSLAYIKKLALSNARIGTPAPEALLQAFDLKQMTYLCMEKCHQPSLFLRALANLGDLRLQTFVLETGKFSEIKDDQEPARVLGTFLKAFTGLKALKLHILASVKACIISGMAIAQYQATLEILSIDFGKRSKCIWTADEISSVTQTCIKLRQLNLVMSQNDLSSGGPSFFRRWDKPFDHQTAFYVAL